MWVVIYLIIAVVLYGGYYYFVMAPKGGAYNYGTATPTTAETPAAMNATEMTIQLAEENTSGESGTALLREENGKTTVTVSLTGFVPGVVQPAHIHVGACPGVGAVKYPLTSVTDGTSVTELPVTIVQLKSELPLALNVHKSGAEATVYTACGALQ